MPGHCLMTENHSERSSSGRLPSRDGAAGSGPSSSVGTLPRGKAAGASVYPSIQGDLSPTARRLLEAARRLLVSSGFGSLSFVAIGREAGEHYSLIRYHFGNKAGLLVALIDWVMHEELQELAGLRAKAKAGADPVAGLMEICREMILGTESSAGFFDLLPHLLDDDRTRAQLADLYAEYRRLNADGLAAETARQQPETVAALAALTVAVTDGLMVQQLIDSSAFDTTYVLALWDSFLRGALSTTGDASAQGPPGSRTPDSPSA
jgi:AcrR family transcriptional regulator